MNDFMAIEEFIEENEFFNLYDELSELAKQEYPGTGLGLGLCMTIVKNYGGTISIESEPGVYSKFIVRLPQLNPFTFESEMERKPLLDLEA